MSKEIERKWVFRGFHEDYLPRRTAWTEIEQIYLVEDPEMPGVERRVRMEKQDGSRPLYSRTWKRDTSSAIERDERDPIITLAEYYYLVRTERDSTCSTIFKRRYSLPLGGRILEIDKYHYVDQLYTSEVEFPTQEAAAAFTLPLSFQEFAESVDGVRKYKNREIARAIKEGRAHELIVV